MKYIRFITLLVACLFCSLLCQAEEVSLKFGKLCITLPKKAKPVSINNERHMVLPSNCRLLLFSTAERKKLPSYIFSDLELKGTKDDSYGGEKGELSIYQGEHSSGMVLVQFPSIGYSIALTWKSDIGKDACKDYLTSIKPASDDSATFEQLYELRKAKRNRNRADEDDDEGDEGDSANLDDARYLPRLAALLIPLIAKDASEEVEKMVRRYRYRKNVEKEVGDVYPENLNYEQLRPFVLSCTLMDEKLELYQKELEKYNDNLYRKTTTYITCNYCGGRGHRNVGNTHQRCPKCKGRGSTKKKEKVKSSFYERQIKDKEVWILPLQTAREKIEKLTVTLISHQLTKTPIDLKSLASSLYNEQSCFSRYNIHRPSINALLVNTSGNQNQPYNRPSNGTHTNPGSTGNTPPTLDPRCQAQLLRARARLLEKEKYLLNATDEVQVLKHKASILEIKEAIKKLEAGIYVSVPY